MLAVLLITEAPTHSYAIIACRTDTELTLAVLLITDATTYLYVRRTHTHTSLTVHVRTSLLQVGLTHSKLTIM